MIDPRDMGTPGQKEWHEFKATAAPFRLMAWLLGELDEVAPEYFEDLRSRFAEGFSNSDWFSVDDPDYDGGVPIQGYSGHRVTVIDRSDAVELERQLFPHDKPEGDFRYWAWAAVVIGIHSALEHYAKARGAKLRRTTLPNAVRVLVRGAAPSQTFPADLADELTLFDESRHALIHNRGIVTSRFVENVKANRLQLGEQIPLNEARVEAFILAAWATAEMIRKLPPNATM